MNSQYLGYCVIFFSTLSLISGMYDDNWKLILANLTAIIGWLLYTMEQKDNETLSR